MYGGLILALPVIMWQIWRFVVPGSARQGEALRDPVHPRRRVVAVPARRARSPTSRSSKALQFLIAWAGEDVEQVFQVSKYVRLVVLMVAAFGVGFQFPVLLVFLQLVGVLTPQQLLRGWRYAIVGIVVVAAVDHAVGRPDLAAGPGRADARPVLRRRSASAGSSSDDAAGRTSAPSDRRQRSDRPDRAVRRPGAIRRRAIRSRSTASSSRPSTRSTTATTSSSPRPTGSGKTVVAEYGIEATRRDGRRAFYTAPLKALSNQKYRDLVDALRRRTRSAC